MIHHCHRCDTIPVMDGFYIALGIHVIVFSALVVTFFGFQNRRQQNLTQRLQILDEQLRQIQSQRDVLLDLIQQQQNDQRDQRQKFDEHQIKGLKLIQDSLTQVITAVREQVSSTLSQHGQHLGQRLDKLTDATQLKLQEISQRVDYKLAEGFEKTTATFTDVVKRLTVIDEAQKKITELSSNMMTLQDILADKRSRGALGEVQLSHLIHNMLPESHYALQYTLPNGKRCDCILFLPEPTGNIVIDAKFPLENYQQLHNSQLSEADRQRIEQQFRNDIRKHIRDIAEKYIIPNETTEGAVMFIPAESVFAEIHAHYPELIENAHQSRVWLVSPTTLMAVLNTVRAVLKDAATRKQVHIIQEHLVALGKDFERFQKRMDNLARHIDLAHQDVAQVHQSSQKISSRFNKIERVELEKSGTPLLENTELE